MPHLYNPPPGGDLDAAWDKAKTALLHRPPGSLALNYFYTYECFVPAQVCATVNKAYTLKFSVLCCGFRASLLKAMPLTTPRTSIGSTLSL